MDGNNSMKLTYEYNGKNGLKCEHFYIVRLKHPYLNLFVYMSYYSFYNTQYHS